MAAAMVSVVGSAGFGGFGGTGSEQRSQPAVRATNRPRTARAASLPSSRCYETVLRPGRSSQAGHRETAPSAPRPCDGDRTANRRAPRPRCRPYHQPEPLQSVSFAP